MKNVPTKKFLNQLWEYCKIFYSWTPFTMGADSNSLSDFIGWLEKSTITCSDCGNNLHMRDHYDGCSFGKKQAESLNG